MRQKCIVQYQVATYKGDVVVYCDDDDATDVIIAKAKRYLSRNASLPFGYQSFKIISREYYEGI